MGTSVPRETSGRRPGSSGGARRPSGRVTGPDLGPRKPGGAKSKGGKKICNTKGGGGGAGWIMIRWVNLHLISLDFLPDEKGVRMVKMIFVFCVFFFLLFFVLKTSIHYHKQHVLG